MPRTSCNRPFKSPFTSPNPNSNPNTNTNPNPNPNPNLYISTSLSIPPYPDPNPTLTLTLTLTRTLIFPGGPGRIGDTSQKGNWSCFRNEILNSTTPMIISYKTLLCELPTRGILEFDFMSYHRVNQHPSQRLTNCINKLNGKRLFSVLEKCALMSHLDRHEALRYLHKCREDCNRIVKVRIYCCGHN